MASPSPDSASVDESFVRFARTGDAGALARVFDQTAPELLRLASHLVSDLALAEDLVQTTFLAAIESCTDYDPSRPVLRWLTGILTNRARQLRRKIARQPDPARVSPGSVQDPPQEAAATEFTEALGSAIAGLPELYRPVLLMHLRLEQPVQEIALVLGRAPGTVRKQLARGMELLRKVLPAGFAATVSSTVLPGQGLAAIREQVLGASTMTASASVAGAAITPAIIGGFSLMKKTLIAVAALLVAWLVYVAWPDTRAGDLTSATDRSQGMQSPLAEADRDAARAMQPSAPATLERRELDDAVLDRPLLVRVVDESGRPLSGVTVGLAVVRTESGGTRPERFVLPATDLAGITRQDHVRFLTEGRAAAVELYMHLFGGTGAPTLVELNDMTGEPIDVVAPPFGSVEVALLGPQGQPWRAGTELSALITGEPTGERRTSTNNVTLGLDGRGIAEPVLLGQELRALVWSGASLQKSFAGPTRAGERVVVEVAMPVDTPLLVGRILGLSGISVPHYVDFFANDDSGSVQIAPDQQGGFRVPLEDSYLGSQPTITLIRIDSSGEATDEMVRVIARAPLVAGANDLGDLILSQAPTLVAGRIEWVDGTPVESLDSIVRVERDRSDRPTWSWDTSLHPRPLGDGRFAVRGFPRETRYRIRLEGEFVPLEPVEFVPGTENLVLRVEKGGKVMASFLRDASTPWRSFEYRLETMEDATREDSLSRYAREQRELEKPYLSPEKLVCQWQQLKPGTYRLTVRCPGIEEPLVDVQNLLVPAGGSADDSRLSSIDLRGLVREFTVTVTDLAGKPIQASSWGAVIVKGSDDATTPWVGRGLHSEYGRVQVLSTHPVDLLVVAPRFLSREVSGVFADTKVTLEPAPEIVLRPAQPIPELPPGVLLNLQLGFPRSASGGVAVTIQNAEGRMHAGAGLGFVMGRMPERLELGASSVSFYSRLPGTRTWQLSLRRRVEGQTRSEAVALQPDSVDLTDAVDGQVIELHIDRESLNAALERIMR